MLVIREFLPQLSAKRLGRRSIASWTSGSRQGEQGHRREVSQNSGQCVSGNKHAGIRRFSRVRTFCDERIVHPVRRRQQVKLRPQPVRSQSRLQTPVSCKRARRMHPRRRSGAAGLPEKTTSRNLHAILSSLPDEALPAQLSSERLTTDSKASGGTVEVLPTTSD